MIESASNLINEINDVDIRQPIAHPQFSILYKLHVIYVYMYTCNNTLRCIMHVSVGHDAPELLDTRYFEA